MAAVPAFQVTTVFSYVAQTAHTYATQAIGTAAADRLVFVGVASQIVSPTISTLTIGGITATQVPGSMVNLGAVQGQTEWWWALVPSGTTADIIVTYSANQSGSTRIFVYSVVGADTTTPYSDVKTVVGSAASQSLSLTIPASGGGMGIASSTSRGAASYTWSNLTEDTDQGTTGTSASSTTPGTVTVTITPSTSTSVVMSCIAVQAATPAAFVPYTPVQQMGPIQAQ
jgi:hypothetical protein